MQAKRVKPSWCKPKIKTVKWSKEFIDELIKYGKDVLKAMEEKGCIKFIRKGSGVENIIVKVECSEWYVKEPIKVNITMSKN